MIFLRDCAVIEDSIYFHPTQSIQYSHSITRTRRISLIEHIKETRNGNWKSFFFSSSNTIAEIPTESGVLRHTGSSAGVNTSPLIGALLLVLFRMSVLRLRLLLLDILSLTLSLLIELLVLGFDFGSTMLRFTAAAGRQFNIDSPRGIFAIIEHGVVVELQAGLHAVIVVKFDKTESTAFGRFVFLSSYAN